MDLLSCSGKEHESLLPPPPTDFLSILIIDSSLTSFHSLLLSSYSDNPPKAGAITAYRTSADTFIIILNYIPTTTSSAIFRVFHSFISHYHHNHLLYPIRVASLTPPPVPLFHSWGISVGSLFLSPPVGRLCCCSPGDPEILLLLCKVRTK